MEKPFAPSAERNKQAILEALRDSLGQVHRVLEIGSGTGQHAVHIAQSLDHLEWQSSELEERIEGVRAWTSEAALANLPAPIVIDVNSDDWRCPPVQAVFSANTVHYMPWASVAFLFRGVAKLLDNDGVFLLYGPFNYDGEYVSDGNRQLDIWLAQQNPEYAIRDIEKIIAVAGEHGFELREDCPMPANNRLLIWRRSGSHKT
jgi:cyclopropane fatty-acyl-phospholipid synthase-like methyltransferase